MARAAAAPAEMAAAEAPAASAEKVPALRLATPLPAPTLAPLHLAHAEALYQIVRDPGVMKWVANGRLWSRSKLRRFLRYCHQDQLQERLDLFQGPPGEGPYLFRGVFLGGLGEGRRLAGVVGVHPISYDAAAHGLFFLTIYLARWAQGQKVGTLAAKAALEAFWRRSPQSPVWIDTLASNRKARYMAGSVGFTDNNGPKPPSHIWRAVILPPVSAPPPPRAALAAAPLPGGPESLFLAGEPGLSPFPA